MNQVEVTNMPKRKSRTVTLEELVKFYAAAKGISQETINILMPGEIREQVIDTKFGFHDYEDGNG